MGRKSHAKREQKGTSVSRSPLRDTPNWPLLALSGLGAALAGYLAWTAFMGSSVQGCVEGSGCDVVLSSRWATLLGLPTAFWGLLAYLALAGTAFIARAHQQWRLAWTIASFGVLYSAYLTTISLTMLGAACPYCLTSLALMTAIAGLLYLQRPDPLPGFTWQRWLTRRGPLAVGLIVFLHLNYIGVVGKPPAVEDPVLRALAVHLVDSGAKMYGADWCSHCQQQKELFGPAARRLPYIECSLGAQTSGQTAECRDERITTYPTWVINGQRYEQVLTPARLIQLTGFNPATATTSATSQ